MICMLISLVLIAAYIVYAISAMQGIPWSVSDTYYQLDKWGHPKWLFQAAMIVPAFLLLPAWLDVSPVEIQFLAFLSGAGLIFVGAAPCFKLELEGKVNNNAYRASSFEMEAKLNQDNPNYLKERKVGSVVSLLRQDIKTRPILTNKAGTGRLSINNKHMNMYE